MILWWQLMSDQAFHSVLNRIAGMKPVGPSRLSGLMTPGVEGWHTQEQGIGSTKAVESSFEEATVENTDICAAVFEGHHLSAHFSLPKLGKVGVALLPASSISISNLHVQLSRSSARTILGEKLNFIYLRSSQPGELDLDLCPSWSHNNFCSQISPPDLFPLPHY